MIIYYLDSIFVFRQTKSASVYLSIIHIGNLCHARIFEKRFYSSIEKKSVRSSLTKSTDKNNCLFPLVNLIRTINITSSETY